MADSLLAKLTSSVKPSTLAEIATLLGVPEHSAASGLALSAASMFAAMSNKAGDPEAMRQVIDTASKTPADAIASGVSRGQLTDLGSSLMATGRSTVSWLFGGNASRVADLIGREAGLGSGATATMMALGANALLSFIGGRVRDDGMTASSLANFLRSEAPGLRKTLPPALSDAFVTHVADSSRAVDVNPVVAQAVVHKERSWVPWLALPAILIAGALWYGSRAPRTVPEAAVPVGTTGTIAARPDLGTYVPHTLVDGTKIVVPERGVENRLLAFIGSGQAPDKTTWFDFDRLLFDTGSPTLEPASRDQLQSVAAILKAYPNTHVKIGGYTDNVGSETANLKLSEERANNVRNELINMGVDENRLTAEGYGDSHPVGDNSTEAGRAMNRRISMLVTQK